MGIPIVSGAPAHPIASSALCLGMMSMAFREIRNTHGMASSTYPRGGVINVRA